MAFDNTQNEAIMHGNGPCMVLAGPGSGKTTVITHLIKNLIEEQNVSPMNILVVTFTKAAAMEMEERFLKLMEFSKDYSMCKQVTFGTFHSVLFKILKYAYNYNAGNILREEKKREYIKRIIEKLELEYDDENEFISDIISEIGLVKSEMINLSSYYSKNCPETIFRRIYSEYHEILYKTGEIDFDDMLVMCYELLTKRLDILKLWQEKFKYILVDEFQDINKVQYLVMKLLAAPDNNIFIVGDDDQSIYSFRGAKPDIMLSFPKEYENTKIVKLNVNYRCNYEVVEASKRLINHNNVRYEKDIQAHNNKIYPIEVVKVANTSEQSLIVMKLMEQYLNKGLKYKDIAVLYRTSINPRHLATKLMEYNIPFKMRDAMPNIFEHWIAKNIISYIKVALGDYDRAHFLNIINRPKRYISREAFKDKEVSFESLKNFYGTKQYVVERIEKLEYDLKLIGKMSPYAAINYIRHGVGYEDYIAEYAEYRRIKADELYEILDELAMLSKDFDIYEKWFAYMDKYKEEMKRQEEMRYKMEDGVTLSTMHGAKGLEYRVVIIIDANELVTPHMKAVLPEDIEEERRMFYVAMTRAKEKLHILYLDKRFEKEMEPSRFIDEISQ